MTRMNQKPSKPDRAWKLLSKQWAWAQGCYARNRLGVCCSAENEHAVCFCVIGALHRVYGPPSSNPFNRKADKVLRRVRKLGFDSIPDWNDAEGRKKSEVVALLREEDV